MCEENCANPSRVKAIGRRRPSTPRFNKVSNMSSITNEDRPWCIPEAHTKLGQGHDTPTKLTAGECPSRTSVVFVKVSIHLHLVHQRTPEPWSRVCMFVFGDIISLSILFELFRKEGFEDFSHQAGDRTAGNEVVPHCYSSDASSMAYHSFGRQ